MKVGFWILAFFLAFAVLWIIHLFTRMRSDPAPESSIPMNLPLSFGAEKRKHPRTDVSWPVSMETSHGSVAAEVKNISVGGAFVCCQRPLPTGEVFHLTMLVPGGERLTAIAQVVWSNIDIPEKEVILRGMGVRFIKMSDQHFRLVERLFKKE